MSEKRQGTNKSALLLTLVPACILGFCIGFILIRFVDPLVVESRSGFGLVLLAYALFLVAAFASIFLQVIVHEAGHLAFGLLTGYSFSSFRIGNLMLTRQNGRFAFRRFSLAGTLGQCLLVPPPDEGAPMPYVLYNLGGVIFNLLFSALSLLFAAALPADSFGKAFCLLFAAIGIFFALTNGVPLRSSTVDNDGRNALFLGKTPAALASLRHQLLMNAALLGGQSLSEMPDEWFPLPAEDEWKNSMCASAAVFYENRLMDKGDLAAATALIDRLLAAETAVLPLHASLLVCDRVFCKLINENDPAGVRALRTPTQEKFEKSMKNFPSVLRTRYALALLWDKDPAGAASIRAQFEKAARKYPYPRDVETERRLMAEADEAARCPITK